MLSSRILVTGLAALVHAPGLVLAQKPAAAPATPPSLVALRWEGYGESEGCLGVPSLMARVEDHLGRRAFDPTSTQVVSVTVGVLGGNRFRAVVRVLDESGKVLGERELVTDETTCSALDEPLVLAVALLVDAELGAEPEPEPQPLAPEPPPPEPPEPPREPTAREVAEEEPPPEPWRFALDLSLLGADGVLPSLAIGAELGFQLDPPWLFPIRSRVVGFFPQRADLDPAGSIDFVLALAGVAGCPLSVRPGTFAIDGCAGVDLLAQHAESQGLTNARQRTEWFTQGSLSLRVQMDVHGPWYAVLGTSVGFPIRAPRFVYRRSGYTEPVFQMADATLAAGLGVGVRFSP